LRARALDVGRDRAFLVGDAAGYIDAITGEGMSLAIGGALACANAIAAAVEAGESTEAIDGARARYRAARAAAFRDHAILTHGLIELARRPFLAKRAIARLAKDPALFSRLLAVNDGTRPLTSLGVVGVLKLVVGATPSSP
jgi:flavin-dependent dehydrogenase